MRAMSIKFNTEKMADEVTMVEITNYKDYYQLINSDIFDVAMVEWDKQPISIFVDDEGMLKSGNHGRMVKGYPQPLFGDIVIVGGVDQEGETLPLPDEFSPVNINMYVGPVRYITN